MARNYVTGPVPVFVGNHAGVPTFLGHFERPPRIQVRRTWQDVYCDLGGQKTPFDVIYDGSDALVTGDLIRFNYPVYRTIADVALLDLDITFNPGTNGPGERGTLMVSEGFAPPLWLQWPFGGKPSMSAGGLPLGMHFLASYLQSPDDIQPGLAPFKIHVTWHCLSTFDPGGVNTNFSGFGQFSLYDFDMSGIVGVAVN